jgi:hypothetical protein
MNKEELKQKFYTDNTVPYGNAGCRIDMPPNTVWNWIESNIVSELDKLKAENEELKEEVEHLRKRPRVNDGPLN